jgi:hypothetical protein
VFVLSAAIFGCILIDALRISNIQRWFASSDEMDAS